MTMAIAWTEFDVYGISAGWNGAMQSYFRFEPNADPDTVTALYDSPLPAGPAFTIVNPPMNLDDDGNFEGALDYEAAFEFLKANPLYNMFVRDIAGTLQPVRAFGRTAEQPMADILISPIDATIVYLGTIGPSVMVAIDPTIAGDDPMKVYQNVTAIMAAAAFRQIRHISQLAPLIVPSDTGASVATSQRLAQRQMAANSRGYNLTCAQQVVIRIGSLLTQTF